MVKIAMYCATVCVGALLAGAGCNIVTGPGTSLGKTTASPGAVRLPSKQTTPVATVRPLAISPIKIVPLIEEYFNNHLLRVTAGGKIFSSFYVYAEEERGGELYYYLWAVVREYVKRGTSVQIAQGISKPLIVVLGQDADGVYSRVLGYREANSSSAEAAVQELYPAVARDLVAQSPADHARRLDLLERETITKAREFYSLGDPVNISQIETQKCTNLKFENYTDLTPFTGNFRQFSMPSFARGNERISTAISNAYAASYVFAGRFGIASWSCGTNCQEHAVVDPATGSIVGRAFRGDYGLDYRQESRLLVVNPYRNILKPNVKVTTSYLLLKDGNTPSLSTLCSYSPASTSVSPLFIDAGTEAVRRYFSSNVNECFSLRIECNNNERYFTDDSGCGCEASAVIE
mgnify:CR=1 FL=1